MKNLIVSLIAIFICGVHFAQINYELDSIKFVDNEKLCIYDSTSISCYDLNKRKNKVVVNGISIQISKKLEYDSIVSNYFVQNYEDPRSLKSISMRHIAVFNALFINGRLINISIDSRTGDQSFDENIAPLLDSIVEYYNRSKTTSCDSHCIRKIVVDFDKVLFEQITLNNSQN